MTLPEAPMMMEIVGVCDVGWHKVVMYNQVWKRTWYVVGGKEQSGMSRDTRSRWYGVGCSGRGLLQQRRKLL
jgi:hypothetical protein